MMNEMMERKITKGVLKKAFWRMQLFQMSRNYERMQSLGFLYSIKPVLKKLYANATKEERISAIKRHLEFFNTQPTMCGPILGVTAAMEENTDEASKKSVSGIKVGLMGPLAGLGDSLLWFTWLPICNSIGASFALEGNPIGLIIMFLMFNLVNIPLKYYGIMYGYEKGMALLGSSGDTSGSTMLQRYAKMGTVLGLIILGGLISQIVKFNVVWTATVGEVSISIQEMLDKIMPNILPLLITLGCYYSLKKSNGKVAVLLIFLIIIISVLLTWAGILA